VIGLVLVSSVESFRRGLAAALSASGHNVVERHGLDGLNGKERNVFDMWVLLYMKTDEFTGTKSPGTRWIGVALVDTGDLAAVRSAFDGGAMAVVDKRASTEELANVVSAAAEGLALVRPSLLRRLMEPGGEPATGCVLTPDELGYLRRLAKGATVFELAEDSNRSERDLYRVLSNMWARLGVEDRTAGLVLAAEAGWLRDHSESRPGRR